MRTEKSHSNPSHHTSVSPNSQAEKTLSLVTPRPTRQRHRFGWCLTTPSQGSRAWTPPAHLQPLTDTCPTGTHYSLTPKERPRAVTGKSHLCQCHPRVTPFKTAGFKAEPGLCCFQKFIDRDGGIVMNTSSFFSKWNLNNLEHKGKFWEGKTWLKRSGCFAMFVTVSARKQRKVISWDSYG